MSSTELRLLFTKIDPDRDGKQIGAIHLGEVIAFDQTIGPIHFVNQPAWKPEPVVAHTAGFIISRRAISQSLQGNCLYVVARPCEI
jgi:predicted deacylase